MPLFFNNITPFIKLIIQRQPFLKHMVKLLHLQNEGILTSFPLLANVTKPHKLIIDNLVY